MMRTVVVVVVAVKKSFKKYRSNIPGKHEINEIQKTTILGTAHTHFGKY
jgi:hypothetical protein